MLRLVALTAGALALVACSPSESKRTADPAAVAAAVKPMFDGLALAGGPAEAKASGFTDCNAPDGATYYGFLCAKPDAALYGVKAMRAQVRLSYPDELKPDERRPERTRYTEVEYLYPDAMIDYSDCPTTSDDLYACATNPDAPLARLAGALKHDGWLSRSRRWGLVYVKDGQPFEIVIPHDSRAGDVYVTLRPTPLAYVEAQVAEIRAVRARAEQAQRDSDAFVQSMAAP